MFKRAWFLNVALNLYCLFGSAFSLLASCCTVTPFHLINYQNPTVFLGAGFLSDGCYIALKQGIIYTTSYDPVTCAFANPVANPLGFIASETLAFINKPACQRVLVADFAGNAVHSYAVSNCQIGAQDAPISILQPAQIVCNSSCAVILGVNSGVPFINSYSVAADCSLNFVSTAPFPVGIGILDNMRISSPASPCSLLVILRISGGGFQVVPLNNCSLGAAVTIPGALGTVDAAFSPNGKWLAVSAQLNPRLQIFQINNDCSLTLIQSVNSPQIHQNITYSPDSLCLAASLTTNQLVTYPVNNDGTIDITDASSLAVPLGTLSYSPANAHCKLLAVATSIALGAGAQILQANSASFSVTKTSTFLTEKMARFTITVTNDGNVDLTNLTLSDLLPSGVTFINASGAGWIFTKLGQQVEGFLALLPVGQTTQVTIDVCVSCKKAVVINTVSVTGTALGCGQITKSAVAALECPRKHCKQ